MSGRVAVVVAAGGAGRRVGGLRKQYRTLAGEPVLVHALRPLLDCPAVEWVVIAMPEAEVRRPPDWLAGLDPRVSIVGGGLERSDSVRRALAAVPAAADVVLVHDAARPLVTRAIVDRVLAAVVPGTGAIAAVPVADTIKEVDEDGRVVGTPDRRRLRRAQTPQAFPRRLLAEAHRRAVTEGRTATDDAGLVERYGGAVRVVDGSPENLKVTTPMDLVLAEALLQRRGRNGGE